MLVKIYFSLSVI